MSSAGPEQMPNVGLQVEQLYRKLGRQPAGAFLTRERVAKATGASLRTVARERARLVEEGKLATVEVRVSRNGHPFTFAWTFWLERAWRPPAELLALAAGKASELAGRFLSGPCGVKLPWSKARLTAGLEALMARQYLAPGSVVSSAHLPGREATGVPSPPAWRALRRLAQLGLGRRSRLRVALWIERAAQLCGVAEEAAAALLAQQARSAAHLLDRLKRPEYSHPREWLAGEGAYVAWMAAESKEPHGHKATEEILRAGQASRSNSQEDRKEEKRQAEARAEFERLLRKEQAEAEWERTSGRWQA